MRSILMGMMLAMAGMAGCAESGEPTVDETEAALIPSYTLHVASNHFAHKVKNLNTNTFAPCPGYSCNIAYLSGTPVVVSPSPDGWDDANCMRFDHWEGDCTGSTCSLTMNSDKSVYASWAPILGCNPK